MELLANNIKDTALIFEGGGMRNSYSAAVVNVLLENNLYFDAVYGLSAGASNAINYLSRDRERSKAVFTEHTDDIPFRKSLTAAMWGGLLGPSFIGKQRPLMSKTPFDFAAFQANPACLTIEAVERDTGKTTYWTREDFGTEDELMERVQASNSYPIVLPPTRLREQRQVAYYDGTVGEGGGIMLPRAEHDGFKKYFVVCTQPKGYRKSSQSNMLYDLFFWRRPYMRELFDTWADRYNQQLDILEKLEESGRAYVFYANDAVVINSELHRGALRENYERGYLQAQSELADWIAFLGL